MMELLLALVAAVAGLAGLWRRSEGLKKQAISRAETAEASLDAVNRASRAIDEQIEQEVTQHDDDQKRIDARRYFGD